MWIIFSLLWLLLRITTVCPINCYSCNSRNYTNLACHDPFHPANVSYVEHCKTAKALHVGEFPASFCIKVKGFNAQTEEELVIRACSMENMNNQCGIFKFEKETLRGCIVTCATDGCNRASHNPYYYTSSVKIHFLLLLSLCICKIIRRF